MSCDTQMTLWLVLQGLKLLFIVLAFLALAWVELPKWWRLTVRYLGIVAITLAVVADLVWLACR